MTHDGGLWQPWHETSAEDAAAHATRPAAEGTPTAISAPPGPPAPSPAPTVPPAPSPPPLDPEAARRALRTKVAAAVGAIVLVSGAAIAVLGHRGAGATGVTSAASPSAAVPAPLTSSDPAVDGAAPVALDPSSSDPAASDPATDTPSDPVSPTTDPTATATTSVEDIEAQARQQLPQLAAEGRSITNLDGEWAAQLASKAIGISDDSQTSSSGSHTFWARDILAQYQQLAQRFGPYGDVRLLSSLDYGKRTTWRNNPIYVTLLFAAFDSPEAVQAFCQQQYPTLSGKPLENVCLPRQINPPS